MFDFLKPQLPTQCDLCHRPKSSSPFSLCEPCGQMIQRLMAIEERKQLKAEFDERTKRVGGSHQPEERGSRFGSQVRAYGSQRLRDIYGLEDAPAPEPTRWRTSKKRASNTYSSGTKRVTK